MFRHLGTETFCLLRQGYIIRGKWVSKLEGSPPSRPFSILLPLPCPQLPARAQKTILQPNLSVLQLKDFATPVISQYSFHARIMKRGPPFILHHFWTGVGC
jgi:hypothetical protein